MVQGQGPCALRHGRSYGERVGRIQSRKRVAERMDQGVRGRVTPMTGTQFELALNLM